MRDDLPTRIKFAQFIHAAREASVGVSLSAGEYAIGLQTRPGITLEDVSRRLISAKIKHKRIYESDPPYNGEFMSIGVVPTERDRVRRVLSDLPSAR